MPFIHLGVFDHLSGLTDFLLAFHLLGADVQQCNPRALQPQRMTRQNLTHKSKFGQIDGVTFGVGAQIKHNIFTGAVRHNTDNGRTMNLGNRLERQLGDGHQRTGIAGGNHRLRLTGTYGVNCHKHAGIAVADNRRGFVFVMHHLGRMTEFADLFQSRELFQKRRYLSGIAKYEESYIRMFFGCNCQPFYNDSGGVVSPHCIYGYDHIIFSQCLLRHNMALKA